MACNSPPAVAPYGGSRALLGTNPIAWRAPRASGNPPIVVDFATATIAEGKLRIAHAIGSKAPLGAVVDKHGQPSTDTAAFYDGGALTTFGGYKGFGLSVMAELMAGMLSGTGSSSDPDYNQGNGTALFAIDVGRFLPADDFMGQVDALEGRLHAGRPAAGFDAVQMPGEPEWRSRSRRTAEGIPLPSPPPPPVHDPAREHGRHPPLTGPARRTALAG